MKLIILALLIGLAVSEDFTNDKRRLLYPGLTPSQLDSQSQFSSASDETNVNFIRRHVAMPVLGAYGYGLGYGAPLTYGGIYGYQIAGALLRKRRETEESYGLPQYSPLIKRDLVTSPGEEDTTFELPAEEKRHLLYPGFLYGYGYPGALAGVAYPAGGFGYVQRKRRETWPHGFDFERLVALDDHSTDESSNQRRLPEKRHAHLPIFDSQFAVYSPFNFEHSKRHLVLPAYGYYGLTL